MASYAIYLLIHSSFFLLLSLIQSKNFDNTKACCFPMCVYTRAHTHTHQLGREVRQRLQNTACLVKHRIRCSAQLSGGDLEFLRGPRLARSVLHASLLQSDRIGHEWSSSMTAMSTSRPPTTSIRIPKWGKWSKIRGGVAASPGKSYRTKVGGGLGVLSERAGWTDQS